MGKSVVMAVGLALLWALPALGGELVGRLEQGGLVQGRTRPGAEVTLEGRAVPVDAQGRFLLGFGRDAPPLLALVVDGEAQTLTVARRDWPVQRIDGLPEAKVSPDPATLERIADDNRRVREARAGVGPIAWFATGVAWPARGPVSGVFGSQRVLNGQPRAPHSGTDIAAGEGSPVMAAAAGRVSLVVPDMVLTGATVMIDHGLGLQSVYAHLSRIDVSPDQEVGRGQIIGAVGHSGRATGPHLHWGVSWLDVKLDPLSVWPVLGAGPGPEASDQDGSSRDSR